MNTPLFVVKPPANQGFRRRNQGGGYTDIANFRNSRGITSACPKKNSRRASRAAFYMIFPLKYPKDFPVRAKPRGEWDYTDMANRAGAEISKGV